VSDWEERLSRMKRKLINCSQNDKYHCPGQPLTNLNPSRTSCITELVLATTIPATRESISKAVTAWRIAALSMVTLLVGLAHITLKGSPQPSHPPNGQRPGCGGPDPYPLVITALLFLSFTLIEITLAAGLYLCCHTQAGQCGRAAYLTSDSGWHSPSGA